MLQKIVSIKFDERDTCNKLNYCKIWTRLLDYPSTDWATKKVTQVTTNIWNFIRHLLKVSKTKFYTCGIHISQRGLTDINERHKKATNKSPRGSFLYTFCEVLKQVLIMHFLIMYSFLIRISDYCLKFFDFYQPNDKIPGASDIPEKLW